MNGRRPCTPAGPTWNARIGTGTRSTRRRGSRSRSTGRRGCCSRPTAPPPPALRRIWPVFTTS
ncbi:hypothetical protein NKH77_55925 [Streptomyces sp. M19]